MSGNKNSPLNSIITGKQKSVVTTAGYRCLIPGSRLCVVSLLSHSLVSQRTRPANYVSLTTDISKRIYLLAEATCELTTQTLKDSIWQTLELNTLRHRVGLLGCPEQDQEVDSMIPVGSLLLQIFCEPQLVPCEVCSSLTAVTLTLKYYLSS